MQYEKIQKNVRSTLYVHIIGTFIYIRTRIYTYVNYVYNDVILLQIISFCVSYIRSVILRLHGYCCCHFFIYFIFLTKWQFWHCSYNNIKPLGAHRFKTMRAQFSFIYYVYQLIGFSSACLLFTVLSNTNNITYMYNTTTWT